MKILKRYVESGKSIEVLDWELPVWITDEMGDRLDNNYYSPSYIEARKKIEPLGTRAFGDLIDNIRSGTNPTEDGDIPLLEGRNLSPNYIMPDIEKYAKISEEDKKEKILKENDILIIKDGSPGTVSVILKPILDFFNGLITAGEHIYIIRLKQEYITLAPFITAFLNSKTGQALLRRYITGAISPSISDSSLKEIPIPMPNEDVVKEAKEKLEELQRIVIEIMHPTKISEKILEKIGIKDDIQSYLPMNWMPAGKRDAHGYYRRG